MKTKFIIVILFLVGCKPNPISTETKTNYETVDMGFHTIVFDGCEYIVYKDNTHGNVVMIHKQNCKFCNIRK